MLIELDSKQTGLTMYPMAKVSALLFSLVAVFSILIWARAEDTSAALRRAQDLEKAVQSRESIPIHLDVLHSDPQCLEADMGLGRSYYALGEYTQAVAIHPRIIKGTYAAPVWHTSRRRSGHASSPAAVASQDLSPVDPIV